MDAPLSRPPAIPACTEELLTALRAGRILARPRLDRLAESWRQAEVERPLALSGTDTVRLRVLQLIEAGHLTTWQGDQILAGRARHLRLGPYRLLERLGGGGNGEVFKAEHRLMKRVVALKVISRGRRQALNPDGKVTPRLSPRAQRFRREVEALARLSHPHVVTAYDATEVRGRLVLVMEYVDGTDLGKLVEQAGPLPLPLACEAIRQACLGLHAAHEQGLVHRDIKPPNLMLVRQPGGSIPDDTEVGLGGTDWQRSVQVKLLDFGLACLAGQQSDKGLVGTPDFIPPERGSDRNNADVRGDLYSLGCTFHYLLTGQVPFPGGTWAEKLLKHHLDRPPRVDALRPDVPPRVAEIVERMMERDLDARYASAAVVATELDRVMRSWPDSLPDTGLPEPAAPPPSNRRVGFPKPAAVTAAVVGGLALAWGARWAMMADVEAADRPKPSPRPVVAALGVTFRVSGQAEVVSTLREAVAAVKEGGIITMHGDGTVRTAPVRIGQKSVTIRTAPGSKACLEWQPAPDEPPWEPLLSCSAHLTLEGLTLRRQEGKHHAGPLVNIAEGTARLRGCTLVSPDSSAAVVSRDGAALELDGCRLEAGAAGVSAEVAASTPCRVRLTGCEVSAARAGGAAVSVWSAELAGTNDVELTLNETGLEGDIGVSLSRLSGPVDVTVRDARFRCRASLVSGISLPAWARQLRWHETGSHYDVGGWLRVDGATVGPADEASWRALSREEP